MKLIKITDEAQIKRLTLETAEFFAQRTGAVNPETTAENWQSLLAQVPDVEPDEQDRFPTTGDTTGRSPE